MNQIPKDMLKNWIVEDLQDVFNIFSDKRYDIFKDSNKLNQIADNIKSLKMWYNE